MPLKGTVVLVTRASASSSAKKDARMTFTGSGQQRRTLPVSKNGSLVLQHGNTVTYETVM